MKKFIAVILSICIILCPLTSLADNVSINIDSLTYDEYAYGETLIVTGSVNRYVTVALYTPQDAGATAKYIVVHSPEEIAEGVSITFGDDPAIWPTGEWTLVVQYGDYGETFEFTLSETVDRSEDENPTEAPTNKPSGNKPSSNQDTSVTAITLEKTDLSLTVGESEKINITSQASSLSVEVDDTSVIAASLSGKTLTVTALKRGESQLWIKTSGNYVTLNVTVSSAPESGNEPIEEATQPSEKPTQPKDEEPTDAPSEEITENPFSDLSDSHWAKDSILSLYSKGIINGMTLDTFAPDEFVTRAQFVTMLQKAFNLEPKFPLSPFDDVKSSDWYFEAVIAAYDNAIATGYNGNFNPNSLVTRQDMATFAYRAAKAAGKTLSVGEKTLFDDDALISSYASDAVYSMRSAGVINGMTDSSFAPLGNATRAQAAHIIAKLLELN